MCILPRLPNGKEWDDSHTFRINSSKYNGMVIKSKNNRKELEGILRSYLFKGMIYNT